MRALPLLALLALLPSTSRAATLVVGPAQPYTTIGAAVDAAVAGDRIEIEAGAYTDDVQIDFDVELVGLGGSAATFWTGDLGRVPLRITGGATVTVEGIGLTSRGNASAIAVFQADLVATDLRIEAVAVSGADGGAIIADRAGITIDTSVLQGNSVDGGGGGHLYAVDSTVTFTATDLLDGSASTGGAIHVERTDLSITGGAISGNSAGDEGGALFVVDGTLTVDGTLLENNDAETASGGWGGSTGDAGAISIDGGATFELIGATLASNSSISTAGAMRVDGSASGTIDGCTFEGNQADYGGGIYVGTSGRIEVIGSTFTANAATAGNGGAIRTRATADSQSLVLLDSVFEQNTATAFGGVLATTSESGAQQGSVVIDGSTFTSNLAQDGGALSLANLASVDVARALFCANLADGEGGAVRVSNAGSTTHRYTNSTFSDNEAGGPGGGLRLDQASPADVFNDNFLGNRGGTGGGLNVELGQADVVNSLFAYTAAGDGLIAPATGPGAISVTYSLFWDNNANDLPAALAGGTGNLFADPGLVAYTADRNCANDEPWPDLGSPLVDAGDPAVDDPDGSPSDIGAYGGPGADWDVFADEDGDGFSAAVDCDDADATVNPAAIESCNGKDDDCDGTVDQDAVDASTFYEDGDGDGYGVEGLPVQACDAGPGLAADAGDCDDDNAAVSPGAAEVCNAIDDDCDSVVDDGVTPSWYPDEDGDGWGADGATIDQCDAPDGHVDQGGDCDDADPDVNPGAADEPGDQLDTNCDGADGTVDEPVDPTAEGLKVNSGCACDQGASPTGAGVLGALLLLVAGRRRR